MTRTARTIGVARSLALYYGIPFRARRLAALYAPFLSRGALAFDVGAHVGNRVRAFRSLGARVVALEPQPDLVRVLRRLYGRDRDVVIMPLAVGRAPGTATLHVAERNPTVSTLSAAWRNRVQQDPSFARVAWSDGDAVAVTTLDALIAAHGEPAFVKIDVEGYESEVLAGLTRPVAALSFEYVLPAIDLAFACLDRLEALGDYAYNVSPGETQRLMFREWIDAPAMRQLLHDRPRGGGSGDVYARLRRPRPHAA